MAGEGVATGLATPGASCRPAAVASSAEESRRNLMSPCTSESATETPASPIRTIFGSNGALAWVSLRGSLETSP